jgi:hypothetical protein
VISTNNIATGMVRGSQVRFQSTKNTLSFGFSKFTNNATAQSKNETVRSNPYLYCDSHDPG